MATFKIHIIKGVNSYTENLLTKEHENVNKRKEVNFNVTDLGNYDRYSNRSKSFAVYKAKANTDKSGIRSKSINISFKNKDKKDKKDNESKDHDDEKEKENKTKKDKKHKESKTDSKKDKKKSDSISMITNLFKRMSGSASGLEKDEDDNDNNENKIEEEDGKENENKENTTNTDSTNNKGNNDDNNDESKPEEEDGNISDLESNVNQENEINGVFDDKLIKGDKTINDLDPNDIKEFNDEDDFGEYHFASSMIQAPESEPEEPVKNDFAFKFQNFKNKVKEAFDPKEFKDMHEKNMEKMKTQLNTIMEKLSKKKEGEEKPEKKKSEEKLSYWESGKNIHSNDEDLNEVENIFKSKTKGRKFRKNKIKKKDKVNLKIDGREFDSDDENIKRCCC